MTEPLPTDLTQWPHGTRTGYYGRGCSCDACRSWQRLQQLDRRRANGVRPKAQQIADAKNTALAELEVFLRNPGDPRHGTATGYNKGCRCDQCRAEQTRRHRANQASARTRPTPEHVHGTTNGYVYYGCRCPRCYAAQSDANRAGRLRRKAAKQANA